MQPLFPDVDVEKVDEAGQIIMYILIVLYSILFIACVAALVHAMRTSKEWNVVKFMKVLLPLPILGMLEYVYCVVILSCISKDYIVSFWVK